MDDAGRALGHCCAVGVHVAHHVVAHFLLPGLGHVVVDVVRRGPSVSSICSWVTGRPSSISVSARAIHSFRQVRNFISGENRYFISLSAYRADRGLRIHLSPCC